MEQKRVFTAEFKREALNLLETSGKSLAQVAREIPNAAHISGMEWLWSSNIRFDKG